MRGPEGIKRVLGSVEFGGPLLGILGVRVELQESAQPSVVSLPSRGGTRLSKSALQEERRHER